MEKIRTKPSVLFWIILTVIWMVVIFSFSAKNAVQSSEQSLRVGLTIGSVVVPDFEEQPQEVKISFAESIEHAVRKMAHASEFAFLSLLMFMSYGFVSRRILHYLLSWGSAVLYAVSDEIHQIFVPGRSCEIKDMLIDTAGITVMLLVIFVIERIIDSYRMKKTPGLVRKRKNT